MWCHLCKLNFTDQEIFKVHIMKEHRPISEFFDDSDSEDSEQMENESSDDMDDSEEDKSEKDFMNLQVEGMDKFPGDRFFINAHEIPGATSNIITRQRTRKGSLSSNETQTNKKNSNCRNNNTNQIKDCSEATGNSNQIFNVDMFTNQGTIDSSRTKNQTMFVYNNITDQLPLPNISGGFDFNSRNVLIWLIKFKEIVRTFKFPLDLQTFKHINFVHKEIFDKYNAASSNEVTSSVLKVYEELDTIIHKHITSVNEQL